MPAKMNYYAAVLKGEEHYAIETVFVFHTQSQRKQWLTEKHFPEGERVMLGARLAKKHEVLEVEFREVSRLGRKMWVWMYKGFPDFLMYNR